MTNIDQICFIGGASKSGTTALYYYLKQHPEIFLPEKKELHYFSRPDVATRCSGPGDKYVLDEIPATLDEYLKHFNVVKPGQVALDISPSYLYFADSAERINHTFPNARMVFLLRNPADKVFSQYSHLRSECRETLSFADALALESERTETGYSDMWLYRDSGFYADRIHKFIEVFGPERIRIYLFDDFIQDPNALLRDLCNFLGVSNNIEFTDPGEVNVSGDPRSKLVSKLLLQPNMFTNQLRRFLRFFLPHGIGQWARENIRTMNAGQKVKLDPDIRARLLSDYADDIRRLETMLGRSTGWIR